MPIKGLMMAVIVLALAALLSACGSAPTTAGNATAPTATVNFETKTFQAKDGNAPVFTQKIEQGQTLIIRFDPRDLVNTSPNLVLDTPSGEELGWTKTTPHGDIQEIRNVIQVGGTYTLSLEFIGESSQNVSGEVQVDWAVVSQ